MAMAATGYRDGEGNALIAPLVGWEPDEIAEFVIVTVDKQGNAGFGVSSGIKAEMVPRVLRAMADGIEKAVTSERG